MPELPEVEIVRRGLEPAMCHQNIAKIAINRRDLRVPVPADFEKKLTNQTVKSLIRRGKYILGFCKNDAVFVLHLGMSGRIYIHPPGTDYTPAKHDHAVFVMENGTYIVFNDPRRFGMLYLTSGQNWHNEKPFNAMGPEPLSNDFYGPMLQQKLHNKRTPVKTALLDQQIVAGIGNIYACEALYRAHIHPKRPANTLTEAENTLLSAAIRDVLNDAIAAGGSSLKDYAHTDGTLGYFQHGFNVYDREGQICPACNDNTTLITRMVQAGRSSFYCPGCQK